AAAPRRLAADRVSEAVADRRVVAARDERAAPVDDVVVSAARDADLEHAAVVIARVVSLEITVLPEGQDGLSRRDRDARRREPLVANDSGIVDEGRVRGGVG